MADLGFTRLSMEPVVCAPDDPAALTDDDIKIVLEQYEILAKEMLRRKKEGHPFIFYHYMLDLTAAPASISACPAAAAEPSMSRSPRGAISTPATSLWERSPTNSGMSGRESATRAAGRSSAAATSMPVRSAVTAGPGSTARAAAPRMPTMPPAASRGSTGRAVSSSKSGLSARSCCRSLKKTCDGNTRF